MTKISVMILMIVIITTTTISSEREMKKTKEADDVGNRLTLLAEIFPQIRRIANVEFYLHFACLQDIVFCSKYQPSTI